MIEINRTRYSGRGREREKGRDGGYVGRSPS